MHNDDSIQRGESQQKPLLLAAALKLAEQHGLHLFPVVFRKGKKIPWRKGWQAAATADPDQIEAWVAEGRHNFGVYAEASGLVVIDTDCKHEGVDGVNSFLEMAGGIEPETFTTISPTGSRHFYFRGDPVKSTNGVLAPGIDVKSRGGFVVAPGSTINGQPYRVLNNAAIAPIPRWLVTTIAQAYTKSEPRNAPPASVKADAAIELDRARVFLTKDALPAIEGNGGDSRTVATAAALHDLAISEDTALDLMAECYNPRCVPPWELDDLAAKVASAYRSAQNAFGCDTVEIDFDILPDDAVTNDNVPSRSKGLRLTPASDVRQEPINWLWPGHFAIGKIGGIAGVQGDGKSQTMCYIAATISRGGDWPEGGKAPKGKVLMLSAEDDPADTIVPRLEAAGADLRNCALMPSVLTTKGKARTLDLGEDIDRIEATLKENPDVMAVLIDPISAYLGGSKTDAYRTSDVRALLTPLGELAAKYRVAVIFVTHFNKGGKGSALSRVTDSGAFTQLTRTFWVAIKEQNHDGKETGRMLFLDAKRNIGGRHEGRAYTIEGKTLPPNGTKRLGAVETSRIVWGEETTMTPDEALAERRPRKASPVADAAADFLVDLLERGPVLSTEVHEAAEDAGHAWITIRRAAGKIGIIIERKERKSWWLIPEINHDEPWPAAA